MVRVMISVTIALIYILYLSLSSSDNHDYMEYTQNLLNPNSTSSLLLLLANISESDDTANEFESINIKKHYKFLNLLTEQVFYHVNQETQANTKFVGETLCKKLYNFSIFDAQLLKNISSTYIKLQFSTEISEKTIKYTSILSLFNIPESYDNSDIYSIFPIYYGKKYVFNIISVNSDYQNSFCDYLKSSNKQIPSHCLCTSQNHIEYYFPQQASEIVNNFHYILSKPFKTCDNTCKEIKSSCSDLGITAVNTCKSLMNKLKCSSCNSKASEGPGLLNQVCQVVNYPKSCSELSSFPILCACEYLINH